MKNQANPNKNGLITSDAFLGNVMPHIKINQKNYPLVGIRPATDLIQRCPVKDKVK